MDEQSRANKIQEVYDRGGTKEAMQAANLDSELSQKERVAAIIHLHEQVGGYMKNALADAIRIGELLLSAKSELQHGEFEKWIEGNLPFTPRTARSYMRLYRERDRLKTETVSDLTSAYKLLSHDEGEKSAHYDDVRSEIEALRKELDDLDDTLPRDEQIRIVKQIVDRLKELQNEAAIKLIRAERNLGRALNEIKADLPKFDEFNRFCLGWGKLFKIYDANPMKFAMDVAALGVDPEVIEWVFSERETITEFPKRYSSIRAVL